MKIKAFLITVLVFTLIFANAVTAATEQTIIPLLDNTQDYVFNFHLSGVNSYASAEIFGKTGTTKIEATITVYELVENDWIYVNHSTKTVNGSYFVNGVYFTAEENSTYKAIYVVHVTNSNDVTESFQRAKYANS